MSDKIKGFTVALEFDITEESAESIRTAILMIKSVIDVEMHVVDHEDYMNRMRIKDEIRDSLYKVFKEI